MIKEKALILFILISQAPNGKTAERATSFPILSILFIVVVPYSTTFIPHTIPEYRDLIIAP
jgi:hypothetical protein